MKGNSTTQKQALRSIAIKHRTIQKELEFVEITGMLSYSSVDKEKKS